MNGVSSRKQLEEDVKRLYSELEVVREELEHYKKIHILPSTLLLIEERVNKLKHAVNVAVSLIPPGPNRNDTIQQLLKIANG